MLKKSTIGEVMKRAMEYGGVITDGVTEVIVSKRGAMDWDKFAKFPKTNDAVFWVKPRLESWKTAKEHMLAGKTVFFEHKGQVFEAYMANGKYAVSIEVLDVKSLKFSTKKIDITGV